MRLLLTSRASARDLACAMPRFEALACFDRMATSTLRSERITSLALSLGASLTDDPSALRTRVRDALATGRVLALDDAPRMRHGGRVDEEASLDRTTDPTPRVVKTWVTVRLVDDSDPPRPVSHARYRIKLPDDTVREGRLDAMGVAHFEDLDPGVCEVCFVDYDQDAWRPIDGGAR